MTRPQDDPLIPFEWFPAASHGRLGAPSALFALVQAAVGLGVAYLLFWWGHLVAAAVVLGICLILGTASVVSAPARVAIHGFFVWLGVWMGRVAGFVLLAPVFYIFFTATHVLSRVSGRDPLAIRGRFRQSYWIESDSVRRKARYASGMFATELPHFSRKPWAVPLLLLVGLAIGSELVLRSLGLGHPVLYRNDPAAGYYPEPNQRVVRKGRVITINEYGMRAPSYAREKGAGDYRVLMLGDSTLWGGTFLDQEEIYARILERNLNRVVGERGVKGRVEVFNMGVNGWGPFHELGYIERFGVFDADLAVVCLPITDVYRPLYYLMMQPFCEVNHPPRLAWEELFSTMIWRYRNGRIHHFGEVEKGELAARGMEAYRRLGEVLRDSGCEVCFEILPSRWAGTTEKTPPNERALVDDLLAALEGGGWTVRFPAGLFVGEGEPDDVYKDGIHLEWLGNRLYADYLTGALAGPGSGFERWLAGAETGEDGVTSGQRSMR